LGIGSKEADRLGEVALFVDVLSTGELGDEPSRDFVEKLAEFFFEKLGVVLAMRIQKCRRVETQKDIGIFTHFLLRHLEASQSEELLKEMAKFGKNKTERIESLLISQFYFQE
jgi:hypothetical protein